MANGNICYRSLDLKFITYVAIDDWTVKLKCFKESKSKRILIENYY